MSDRIWSQSQEEKQHRVQETDQAVVKAQDFTVDEQFVEKEKKPTRFQRKMNRIFGTGQATSTLFLTGFMTGGAVGGIFGGLMGVIQAVRMRSFMVIPISMIATGTSFGFFMGLGMTIRQVS